MVNKEGGVSHFGPKFILTFETEQEKEHVNAEFDEMNEIHEVYTPDWDKCKDQNISFPLNEFSKLKNYYKALK